MRLLHKDFRHGEVKVIVENLDDLWYLSQLIESGDTVQGKTLRKTKVHEEADATKRTVFISIRVDAIEFAKTTTQLRIGGCITQAPEDVPKGNHHTFAVEPGTTITVIKPEWNTYHKYRLADACAPVKSHVLICVFDREEALFATLQNESPVLLSTLKGDVQKKRLEEKAKGGFYETIIKQLCDYDLRHNYSSIILASPAFWKDELAKHVPSVLKKKVVFATCASVDEAGLHEVLHRDETKQALQHERLTIEARAVEELLAAIAKHTPSVYGLKETVNAVNSGAAKKLLITDKLIQKKRQENTFKVIEQLLQTSEVSKTELIIVSSQGPGGKKLDGLGGVGALLRYVIE